MLEIAGDTQAHGPRLNIGYEVTACHEAVGWPAPNHPSFIADVVDEEVIEPRSIVHSGMQIEHGIGGIFQAGGVTFHELTFTCPDVSRVHSDESHAIIESEEILFDSETAHEGGTVRETISTSTGCTDQSRRLRQILRQDGMVQRSAGLQTRPQHRPRLER